MRARVYRTGHRIKKQAIRMVGLGKLRFTREKQFGRRFTKFRLETTHDQIRTPAWTSIPVSFSAGSLYGRVRDIGREVYMEHEPKAKVVKVIGLDVVTVFTARSQHCCEGGRCATRLDVPCCCT